MIESLTFELCHLMLKFEKKGEEQFHVTNQIDF